MVLKTVKCSPWLSDGDLPIEFEVKVVEVGNSLRVAIPVEILRATGIQKGDMLLMTTNDSQIVIRKPSASLVRKKKG